VVLRGCLVLAANAQRGHYNIAAFHQVQHVIGFLLPYPADRIAEYLNTAF